MDSGRIFAALGDIDVEPTPREAVEALWLAARIAEAAKQGAGEDVDPDLPNASGANLPPPQRPGPDLQPAPPDEAGGIDPATPPATLHTPRGPGAASDTSAPARAVRIPAAPALTDELALLRALRPLKRRVPSRHRVVLDEVATAERSAEERLLLPATRPEPDRWFSLALVTEASPSMAVWHPLVTELTTLLQRSGAFRDIRLWHLHFGTDGAAGLHPRAVPTSRLHSPREILDPTGRQAIWFVSDCVSAFWRDGRADRLLQLWGRGGPLAIVQPLPQRLWRRTGLRPERTRLHSPAPGAPNSHLSSSPSQAFRQHRINGESSSPATSDASSRSGTPTTRPGIPVPLLELEPSWLALWARLVTASTPGGVPAVVTMARTSTEPSPDENGAAEPATDDIGPPPTPQDPLSLVRAFRSHASPQAYRLAGYLAAAPLTLPVMRLVQRVMLPESRPAHLAEVLVSGLLLRTGADPAAQEYDFVDGIRGVLLSTIRLSDTRRVYSEVSAYLAAHIGAPKDMLALAVLPSGAGDTTGADPDHPYADMPTEVLSRLGRQARPSATPDPRLGPFAPTASVQVSQGQPGDVGQLLGHLSEIDREVCILLALAHRYSGVPVPAVLFSNLLGVAPSYRVDLRRHVDERLLAILIEESDGMWRLSHSRIAEEVLEQLLLPRGAAQGREAWNAALVTWCQRLVWHAGEVFQRSLPEKMRDLLDRLFIMRDARKPIQPQRAAKYSELLQQMSVPGRKEVMRALVTAFPDQAHYWGHYGRMLSYDSSDFADALRALDQAVSLSPGDPQLHHMRGMVIRNEIRSVSESRTFSNEEFKRRERRILELFESAKASFERATELDDSSEYGYIALAQMSIRGIEFGFRHSGAETYSEFLARQTAGVYRGLLEDAEDALAAVREIRGSGRMSNAALQTQVELLKLYDNYRVLLPGLDSLLDSADTYKPPVRRCLVRAYRQRSGSWRKASLHDVERAVTLLDANLTDDPHDFTSLREWLQVARLLPASLDRAADHVTTWARAESTREALFYDYVLACLRVLVGERAAIAEYRQKLARCREHARRSARHSAACEWLGQGRGLGQLVSQGDLMEDWNLGDGGPPPAYLSRIEGVVSQIRSPTAGTINFGGDIQAFMVPSQAGLVRGQDENRRVTGLLAFSYEGPRAWVVEREGV
ncbi:SAV_2336 N-terminal domain-related protein [Streptomyces mirabilis]|uniref:SAV_2336 N-terminal domain-related protein n=1 Tax=Streptomyces mirabilis TaxID=68239 RepID=UPI0036E45D4B